MLLEVLSLVASFPFHLEALECYICTNEEGNWNDCIRTIQTCEPLQDTCQSIVQYRNQKPVTGFVLTAVTVIDAITMCLEAHYEYGVLIPTQRFSSSVSVEKTVEKFHVGKWFCC
ncbi:unnamed protein product [Schistosoma margrebowiei]|uniref:Saposin B-type domain-containing protein n=1 Tax=Schistosoma margrebowiei TaxID=48269 RepID=A0AA85AQJ8_9TREM|nr:unnamed protein product [Schistosoma margrebowiei]